MKYFVKPWVYGQFALFTLQMMGCSEYKLNASADSEGPGETDGPIISVDPLTIDFGSLSSYDGASASEAIEVGNVGGETLYISELVLVDSEGAFAITSLDSDALEPGDSATFLATYAPPREDDFTGTVQVGSNDPDNPQVDVTLFGGTVAPEIDATPDILVTPEEYDFGVVEVGDSDTTPIMIENIGAGVLTVNALDYDASSAELALDANVGTNGELPWSLAVGEAVEVFVDFVPEGDETAMGTLTVISDDPDEPAEEAWQTGIGKSFDGFSTGWYVYDDGVAYETTSNTDYEVDHHGDTDLYWYEPSGAHGLVDSTDTETDFATMRDYVLAYAGAPIAVTGPFSYDGDSSISTYEYATFTYFMCDFWLEEDADPSTYEISSGVVDDGVQVMVNGEILGQLKLGESGSWSLGNANPGEVNTLIVILVDDSASDKYVTDLAFYKDGVMVEG